MNKKVKMQNIKVSDYLCIVYGRYMVKPKYSIDNDWCQWVTKNTLATMTKSNLKN